MKNSIISVDGIIHKCSVLNCCRAVVVVVKIENSMRLFMLKPAKYLANPLSFVVFDALSFCVT